MCSWCVFFFFKQKTAYEVRISDWSSDVCSSDLAFGTISLKEGFGGMTVVLENEFKASLAVEVLTPDSLGNLATETTFYTSLEHINLPVRGFRSEERRVGKECVSTCRSRWSPSH